MMNPPIVDLFYNRGIFLSMSVFRGIVQLGGVDFFVRAIHESSECFALQSSVSLRSTAPLKRSLLNSLFPLASFWKEVVFSSENDGGLKKCWLLLWNKLKYNWINFERMNILWQAISDAAVCVSTAIFTARMVPLSGVQLSTEDGLWQQKKPAQDSEVTPTRHTKWSKKQEKTDCNYSLKTRTAIYLHFGF